ncbi:HPP family protein [Gemmobacter sp. 24YEA27]|uniref:HPP family protein n=1 Tax=Gemmobacter sp. 24YEA27 TaxID=3040672 RepID=UPI0024B39840|nr:HPP family protein [Gemmobacter sp. 24YEA27]
MGQYLRRTLRHAGPAMGFTGWTETLRATAGMFVGMVALILFLSPDPGASAWGLFVIAPFGASAVLLFAVPNSPLAQPWSAVVGNAVSALVGVALVLTIETPELRIVLAPALAVLAMHLSRALHPPGGRLRWRQCWPRMRRRSSAFSMCWCRSRLARWRWCRWRRWRRH